MIYANIIIKSAQIYEFIHFVQKKSLQKEIVVTFNLQMITNIYT